MIALIFVAFKGDTTQIMTGSKFHHWLKVARQICFKWQIFVVPVHAVPVPHLCWELYFFPLPYSCRYPKH
jgi:hypothetical protein